MKFKLSQDSVEKSYLALQGNYQMIADKLSQAESRNAALVTVNKTMEEKLSAYSRTFDRLKARLKDSAEDIRKFSAEFGSYTDSLIAGMTERVNQSKTSGNHDNPRVSLAADLKEVQNLKANFEAYLESLSTHVDEGQSAWFLLHVEGLTNEAFRFSLMATKIWR